MFMSRFAAKIGTTLIALCLAVGLAGTASATPAGHGDHLPGTTAECYQGDGHTWH